LIEQWNIPVNVEDPPYNGTPPANLDFSFRTGPEGKPADVRSLVEELRQVANARTGFAYRLEEDDGVWTLVATRAPDAQGRFHEFAPLLDRHVTIPLGTRPVVESAKLMAEELSRQTGMHIGCCQSFVAGVPWGLETILFGAHDEPARQVLLRLTRATPGRFNWHTACGPGVDWCFINLEMRPASR
jgi:hypothetical protein